MINFVTAFLRLQTWAAANGLEPQEQTVLLSVFRALNDHGWPEEPEIIPEGELLTWSGLSGVRALRQLREIIRGLAETGILEITEERAGRRIVTAYAINWDRIAHNPRTNSAQNPHDPRTIRAQSAPDAGSDPSLTRGGACAEGLTKTETETETDDDDDMPRAREAAAEAVRARYGRQATPEEAETIACQALDSGCDRETLDEMIDEAVRTASIHGARAPAAYTETVFRQWRISGVRNLTDYGRSQFQRDQYRDGLRPIELLDTGQRGRLICQ